MGGKHDSALFMLVGQLAMHPPHPSSHPARERLRAALEEVCGKEAADSIQLQLAQDGSLLGAAFLAVAAAEWEAAHGGGSGAAA